MSGVIRVVRREFGDVAAVDDVFSRREAVYADLIRLFENYDCDTLEECVGKDVAFDCAWMAHLKE